jgi:hypothetical protein
MAYQIPTTAQLVTRNISFFESKLNQTVPLVDKAYLRVKAVMYAVMQTELFKLNAERGKQALVLTATGEDLDALGIEYGVIRKPAEAAVLQGTIPTTTTVTLPQSYNFTGDNNGVLYFPNSSYTSVANVITADVTARDLGISGNLEIGDTMDMSNALPGSSATLTVTVVLNVGAAEETDDDYRPRVQTAMRAQCGGSNSADYRTWSEEVAGVVRAYPFSGKPYPDEVSSIPPDRVVYVEVSTDIDADGIAPTSILDEVRETIITDPATGRDREVLGLVDVNLYVASIRRTTLYYQVSGLVIDANDEAQAKTDIENGLALYSRNLQPFVAGLDFEGDKNNTVSNLSISNVVNDILSPYGATAEGVVFGLIPGEFIPLLISANDETFKSGGVTYV